MCMYVWMHVCVCVRVRVRVCVDEIVAISPNWQFLNRKQNYCPILN